MKRRAARSAWLIPKIIFGSVVLFLTLFPFYWLIVMSIRPVEDLAGEVTFFPRTVSFGHYLELFRNEGFGRALINSAEVTAVSVLVSLILGLMTAYVAARRRFRLRMKRPLSIWVFVIRILPPVAFVIPLYSMFNRLGLLGTKVPAMLSCMLINTPFIIWFMVSFLRAIPEDIEMSARIDGAGELQLFLRIVLPLIVPEIAAVTILCFLYSWNEYTYSIIFVQNAVNYTVPLSLATMNADGALSRFSVVSAGGVLSVIPILLFVIFAQKQLVSGLAVGAVSE